MEGFYLQWVDGRLCRNLPVEAVYRESDEIGDVNDLLESIFTAPEPSVADISDEGEPVYAEERRGLEEIETVKEIHELILECAKEHAEMYGHNYISKDLAQVLVSMTDNVRLIGEAAKVYRLCHRNEMLIRL